MPRTRTKRTSRRRSKNLFRTTEHFRRGAHPEFERYETYQGYGYRRKPPKEAPAPRTKGGKQKEEIPALWNQIAGQLARGKKYKNLSDQDKATVRSLAAQVKENPKAFRPEVRSTAKTALDLYDKGVSTVYDWSAGLPSRIGHSLLKNPCPCQRCNPRPPHGYRVIQMGSPEYQDIIRHVGSSKRTLDLIRREQAAFGGEIVDIVDGAGKHVTYSLVNMERHTRQNPEFGGVSYRTGVKLPANDEQDQAIAEDLTFALRSMGFSATFIYKEDKTGKPNYTLYTNATKQLVKKVLSGPGVRRRRNPESGADRMYEIFHGRAPQHDVIVESEIHEHEHLATLGKMVSLKVETRSGYVVEIGWDDGDPMTPWLASNEQGTQLYIEGGDQSVDLGSFRMDGQKWRKDMMVIGDLVETTYQTEKDFDKFETIDYYHANGEDSGEVPQLLYDPNSKADRDAKNGKLYIAGGKYRIEHDGIID